MSVSEPGELALFVHSLITALAFVGTIALAMGPLENLIISIAGDGIAANGLAMVLVPILFVVAFLSGHVLANLLLLHTE